MLEKLPITENYYYVAFIAAFTFVLTMITAKGSLTDHRFKWYKWKRYTSRGKQAIIFGLIVALALFFQDINNRNLSNINDLRLTAEQNSKNAEIKKGVEKATDTLFYKLSLAFKKQGLQYDTIKNEVIKLRDSVRITNNYGASPVLYVEEIKIIDSINFDRNYKVYFKISSLEGSSYKINLSLDIFAMTHKSNFIKLGNITPIFFKGQTIEKDHYLSNELTISKDESIYNYYIFRLKGEYFNSDNKKKLIDNFYMLYPRKKNDYFKLPGQLYEDIFRSYVKK